MRACTRGQVASHLDVGLSLDVSLRGQLGRAGSLLPALGHGRFLDAQRVPGLLRQAGAEAQPSVGPASSAARRSGPRGD